MTLKNLKIGSQASCQICDDSNLELFLDLNFQPPCDSLLDGNQLNQPETYYPLRLVRCKKCFLVQLDFVVEPTTLFFPEYPYISGITKSLVQRLRNTSMTIKEKNLIKSDGLVVDIGSNDGTLLNGFKDAGYKVIGVEPSNISDLANRNGIKTYKSFFTPEIASEIKKNHGSASLITATNVFAHVANMHSLMEGVLALLDRDGIFVTESHYLGNIYDTLQFDSIYHEHLKFYSLYTLELLLSYYGFKVIEVEKISNYGGSIRVYASRSSEFKVSDSVADFRLEEKLSNLNDISAITNFSNNVELQRNQIRKLMVTLSGEGKTCLGVGCPGRASTLVNYCGLDVGLLPAILEQKDSLKLGKFLPGTHTPILSEESFLANQPDYLLLLSWHYSKEIISNLRQAGFTSKIIIPLPSLQIVD